jgi:membrane fusion protein (multidrug efflux system)
LTWRKTKFKVTYKRLFPGAQGTQVLDYKVLELQPRSATLNVDYPASIQGQQNIEIRPKVDGYVEKIFVDEGSIVNQRAVAF